jgi:hypothetical protein
MSNPSGFPTNFLIIRISTLEKAKLLFAHSVMKTYGGSGSKARLLLTSALDEIEGSASLLEKGPNVCIMGPESLSGLCGEKKNLSPCRESNACRPALRYTD